MMRRVDGCSWEAVEGRLQSCCIAAALGDAPRVLATPELAPKDVKSAAPKRLEWKNEKLTIEGLLYLPPEAATKKVPLMVQVHGGPLGAYMDGVSAVHGLSAGTGMGGAGD